jgi:PAS domain S-box-containing protein
MNDDSVRTAQPALGQDEAYRALVASAVDAIVTADDTGRIVAWNPAAARLFGYTASEVVGRPLTILVPEGSREAHERGLDRFKS